MRVEFDVKITAADLYDYMLSHTYSGFSGLFGSIVGALFIIMYFSVGYFLYLIAGAVILLYIPCSLFLRAHKQVALNEAFKKPLHYVLTDEGVTVSQGEDEMFQEWDVVYKAKSTNRSLLIYTSKVNAWIFPKRDLGKDKEAVIQLISAHVAPNKVKIKQ
ncbi:MAG: YcxB family protein [Lachnospiraceae bacterium]|nr:YcxB family protein [Lachnospiraceae bacterium]